jgi:hypothetical protein
MELHECLEWARMAGLRQRPVYNGNAMTELESVCCIAGLD